ncbi:hypothetical protein DSM112329_04911 [Paraconexibacter sp. AEG42_29]|uniref:Delta-60 repeat domain-containing protein n=1 Tax=Paraconexibacter sp. AEG42_29 TaxID=2997339 RepID=A0AAU7B2B8_9ACTN
MPRHARRRTAALAVAGAAALSGAADASAASLGALDTAFGGGVVQLPAGTQLHAGAVQTDGKLVVTGFTGKTEDPRLLVARLTPTGTLDTTFGNGGSAAVPLPSGAIGAAGDAVAIQADGKILVAGDALGDSGADGMLVTRLNADGTPDGGFGSGGSAVIERGTGGQGEANAVAVRADGTIVVAGAAIGSEKGVPTGAIGQLKADGSSGGSTRHLDIGESTIRSIALQGDGKIAYAGSRKPGQEIITIVGRANADGTKDSSFGDGGLRQTNFARNGGASSAFRGVAVQPDGKIVATGYAFNGSGAGIDKIVFRVDTAGNPDGAFGPSGVCYFNASASQNINSQIPAGGAGVAIADGHIYTGGGFDQSGLGALAIGAQSDNGSADAAFGNAGQTITPLNDYSPPVYGSGVALGNDGIYVIGSAGNLGGSKAQGVIARYGAYALKADPGPGPGPANPPIPPTEPIKPVTPTTAKLSKASLSPSKISASSKVASRNRTKLSYTLSAAGSVRLIVEQKLQGRRVGSKCVKTTKVNTKKKKCTYYAAVGSSKTLKGKKGSNTLTLTKKITNKTLKPGTYRLVLQVLSGKKTTGAKTTKTLTVTK